MRALVWDGGLTLREDYPQPHPVAGEALVRVSLAGVCNTDLEITRGYASFKGVLGHEFVGVVEKANTEALVGRRVVGEINAGCGECDLCVAGMARHCAERTVLGIANRDGALAEYLTLPVGNLVLVPDEVGDRQAVFVEPLAACFEVLEQVHLQPATTILVLGDGKLGLLMAQVAALGGCQVTVAGHHAEKLAIVERHGIHTASPDGLKRQQFDVVVECTGSAGGLDLAGMLVRPRGTIVLKSTVAGQSELNLAPFVVNEVTVVGSRCGQFAPAVRALAAGHIDVESLIAAEYPLSRAVEAVSHAARRGTLKVLVRP